MRCPSNGKLPPSTRHGKGWPLIEGASQRYERRCDGSTWPRISIITPSYNQGQVIEKTIRSVLHQGYPNLKYIIVDGGSANETVDIIRKYEEFIIYWESESDNGQCHAINKGWDGMSGEITSWLNSDDLLTPGSLR